MHSWNSLLVKELGLSPVCHSESEGDLVSLNVTYEKGWIIGGKKKTNEEKSVGAYALSWVCEQI